LALNCRASTTCAVKTKDPGKNQSAELFCLTIGIFVRYLASLLVWELRWLTVGFMKTAFNEFSIAISTIDRPGNYLHQLMPRMREGLPIRLIVGAPKYGYLERYRQNPHVEIIGIEPGDWEVFKHCPVIHRALWNYWRCFIWGIRPGGRKGLVILEDDVIPAVGWEARLGEIIGQIESEYGDEYVLALHTWFTELPRPAGGRYFKSYPAGKFGGTQAMYYPEPIRAAFSQYLQNEGVESFRTAYDYLLREFLLRTGIPCFATTPCLFQHIGTISTGLSFKFASAGYFKRKCR
jgi:hypothetical protein